MPRPKGSKNVKPAMGGRLDARVPTDIERWIEEQVEGPPNDKANRSAKITGLLRAARAINLKPYYPEGIDGN
jgi:hypothetical protein